MSNNQFIPLALIVIVAFFVPILVAKIPRIRIPAIVAEIVFGIILGKSGLNLIREAAPVDFLATFGFIFLMFLSGFDLDFSIFTSNTGKGKAKGATLPFAIFAATLALAFGSSFLVMKLGMIRDNYLFALILSTTSVGIVFPVIKESAETQTSFGQNIIVTSIIADVATIIFLSLYVLYYSSGTELKLLLMAGLLALFFIILAAGKIMVRLRILARIFDEFAHASTQLKVRGGLALLIIFVVLSQSIGVEAILGAFIAGLCLSLLSGTGKETLSMKLDAIGYGFFIPIFFVMVGARLDIPALLASRRSVLLVPILLVLAYVVKILPSLLLRFTFSMRDSLAGGILMASRLSLIIAVSEIALSMGVIDGTVNAAIVITAIATSIFSPLLYHRVRGKIKRKKPKTVIAGAGRIGRDLVERVEAHTPNVVLIEKHRAQIKKLNLRIKNVIIGDCTDLETLKKADLSPTDVYIALTGSDKDNLDSCLMARKHFGVTRVIARDNNPDNTEEFTSQGVIPLNMTSSLALAAENLILRPALAQMLADEKEGLGAFEVMISNPAFHDTRIKDLKERHDALIVLVKSGDEIVLPHGDTVLHRGDTIVVYGLPDDEHRLRCRLEAQEIDPVCEA